MFEKILGSNGGKKLERAGLIAALTFVLTSCGNDIKKLVGTEPKPATVATEKVPNVVDVTSALNSPATPTVAPSPVAAPVQTGKLNEVEDENSGYKGYEKGQRVNGKDLYRNGSYRLLLEKIQKNLKYPFLIIDFTKFSADEKSEMYDAYRAMAKEWARIANGKILALRVQTNSEEMNNNFVGYALSDTSIVKDMVNGSGLPFQQTRINDAEEYTAGLNVYTQNGNSRTVGRMDPSLLDNKKLSASPIMIGLEEKTENGQDKIKVSLKFPGNITEADLLMFQDKTITIGYGASQKIEGKLSFSSGMKDGKMTNVFVTFQPTNAEGLKALNVNNQNMTLKEGVVVELPIAKIEKRLEDKDKILSVSYKVSEEGTVLGGLVLNEYTKK